MGFFLGRQLISEGSFFQFFLVCWGKFNFSNLDFLGSEMEGYRL